MEGRKEVNFIIKLMHTYHFTQSHVVVNNSGCNLLEHVARYKLVTGKCKWVKHFDVLCIFFFLRKSNPEKAKLTATKVKRKSVIKEHISKYHNL